MNVTYRVDKDILYIAIEGRIDATNASETEEKILNIKAENPSKHTVIDADKLEYISSAGLRVILRLRKEEPKLAIINVAPDVYEVFDMTGFTEMITVEKAYQRMSVDGCEFIAKGANGAVYRYDDETILKWLRIFVRRFFNQQFKRSCMPDGPKVGSVGLSPRGDWDMPSDAWSTLFRDSI